MIPICDTDMDALHDWLALFYYSGIFSPLYDVINKGDHLSISDVSMIHAYTAESGKPKIWTWDLINGPSRLLLYIACGILPSSPYLGGNSFHCFLVVFPSVLWLSWFSG